MKIRNGHLTLPARLHARCRDMVIRLIGANNQLISTGVAFGSSGLIITSGHAIQQHRSKNADSILRIQFLDGCEYPVSKVHEVQFDYKKGLDFSLLHADHGRLFPRVYTTHSIELAKVKFQMWGFSPQVMNGASAIPVSGEFLGPMISVGGESTLLLAEAVTGRYNGFSGAAQFTYHATWGIEIAGIQSGKLGAFPETLVSMPTQRLQGATPLLHTKKITSYPVERKSKDVFSRFAFVCDVFVGDSTSEEGADEIAEAIARYVPALERQLSASKLKKIVIGSSLQQKIVAIAVSHRRPRRVEKRDSLAAAFGRTRWRRNMLKPMTISDLWQISEFREEVIVFQIHGV